MDEHVDAAELIGEPLQHVLVAVAVLERELLGDDLHAGSGYFFLEVGKALVIAREHRDIAALFGEDLDRRPADPARGTADDCLAAFQSQIHTSSPSEYR